ncbi:MAG: serpin family protein, partial [Bacteroidales bacterium]|nr:serpin family protein [Bacteroidales bacterium]
YYYGTWKYEFDEKDNQPIQFKRESGSYKEVEGMRIEADLPYLDNGNFRIAELPYGNDKFSMMILLPNDGFGVEDILANLTIENWKGWIQNMQNPKLALHMPKFTFEYKTLLNDALKNMGLGVAFSGSAEFPLMVQESKNLNISRVIHKTFVDVNEKGTEAAAVTVVEMRETSVGPGDSRISFIVDKPFLFMIREKTSNSIVFMGKVENPG